MCITGNNKWVVPLVVIFIINIHSLGHEICVKSIGGTDAELGWGILYAPQDNYIITGHTSSFGQGAEDILLVKFHASGAIEWAKAIGKLHSDYALDITRTPDNGFVLTGGTESGGAGAADFLLVKFDSSEALQWAKTLGGELMDECYSVQSTPDSGFILAGYTQSYGAGAEDCYICKVDRGGTIQWARTIGGKYSDYAQSIITTPDNGYIFTGFTENFSTSISNLLLVKLSASGEVDWMRSIGGSYRNAGFAITNTSDNGYFIGGGTTSFDAEGEDLLAVKFDSLDQLQWARMIGGSGVERAWKVLENTDTSYIALGYTESFGAGSHDVLLVKLSRTGALEWARAIGGENEEKGYAVTLCPDNGYVITGNTKTFSTGYSDLSFIKVQPDGYTCMGEEVSPTVAYINPIVQPESLQITDALPQIADISLEVLDISPIQTVGCTARLDTIIPNEDIIISIYPNPFTFYCLIKTPEQMEISIFNILGEQIVTAKKTPFMWDPSDSLAAGIYILKANSKEHELSQNVIYLK